MKKFVNLRLPVICACTLSAGIAVGYAFIFYGLDLIWLALAIPAFALPLIVLTLIHKSYKPVVFSVLAALFFIAGALSCIGRLSAYQTSELDENHDGGYEIYGTVKEKGATSYSEYIIIENATANGKKLKANIVAYLSEEYGDYCDVGYTVKFYSALEAYDAFPYGKLNYNAEDNVKYHCSVYGGLTSEYRFNLFGEIRGQIRRTLFNNLSYDTAAVCYAMLTGQTQFIEDGAMQYFRYGGIAHIFAVSGLHIGIVFAIINFFCKRLHMNKYLSAVLCTACVFFYSGVCGFTLSSLRAAIMCTAALISKLIYAKHDGMNALAFAVIIILLITPLSLFAVGFRLSVCAVGGILIFSKQFARWFSKIKVPKKISSALGVSFGAQMGTMPVMLASFGYLSGAGLILNILLIPVLSAMFSLLFVFCALSAIFSGIATFLVPAAALPIELVVSLMLNGGFEKALITGFGAGLFVPLYFVAALSLSDKLNIKFIKRVIAVACSAVILTSFVLAKTYLPINGYKIAVSAYFGGGEVIIKSSQGTVLIITENVNAAQLAEALNEYYASGLDGVIIIGCEECVPAFGNLNINCNDIYICLMNINIQPYGNTAVVHYEKDFTLCGINFEFVDSYTILADCDGVGVCVSAGRTVPIESCDLLIAKYENTDCESDCTVYFGLHDYKYNIYDYGNFTFTAKDGELKMTGIIPDRICLN